MPRRQSLAVVIPLILGNLDDDIRDICEKGTPLVIPFNGFVLGATMNLADVVKAGVPGIILGLISLVFTGFVSYWVFNLVFGRKRRTAVGLGVANTAGNAVVTPKAIGTSDPTWAPYAAGATAQVAAACVVTSVLCPLVTTYVHSKLQKRYAEEDVAAAVSLT
ncbi:MAG: 2-keto-3-deoxygluconate permease [Clostridiaceae bacterium]